jgi:hypothetical protein
VSCGEGNGEGSPSAALCSAGMFTASRRFEITFGCAASEMSMIRAAPTVSAEEIPPPSRNANSSNSSR